jgi:hypothetical protein
LNGSVGVGWGVVVGDLMVGLGEETAGSEWELRVIRDIVVL